MSMDSFFGSLFDIMDNTSLNKCPKCNTTLEDYKKTGLLGCSYCYTYFEDYLAQSIRRVQGGMKHVGKIPKSAKVEILNKRKIDDLKIKLKELIEKEKFEEAAKVRDKIKSVKNTIENGDSNA